MDESRKLFVGPRLKRLRRDLNLSQSRMAEELGLSRVGLRAKMERYDLRRDVFDGE